MEKKYKNHHWYGWPGAWCMDCGAFDPWEEVIGEGVYDPYTETWRDESKKKEVEERDKCYVLYNEKCPQCKKPTR